jgi:hypothetical protein
VRLARGTPISPVPFDISRSIGSNEREKNPINDLFYVLRRQRLPQYHKLIAREVEGQRSPPELDKARALVVEDPETLSGTLVIRTFPSMTI